MLQGQRFQFGNYKLKNLIEAQNRYRIETSKRTGRPIEVLSTPFDDDISSLEEDLNHAENEYNISKENPITESYKNKVKNLTAFDKPPDEDLVTDERNPDLEAWIDEEVKKINPSGAPAEETTNLVGNDIAPDNSVREDRDIRFDNGRVTTKRDILAPGTNVIDQNVTSLKKEMEKRYPNTPMVDNAEPGITDIGIQDNGIPSEDIAPKGNTSILQDVDKKLFEDVYPRMSKMYENQPNTFTSKPEDLPYVPPGVDQEADLMLKNLNLLKAPPLRYKPSVYQAPKNEQFKYDPYQATDKVGTYAKYIKDWSNFAGGRGFTDEAEKHFDKDMSRLDQYRKVQEERLATNYEKNRNSDKDAYEKFKDAENIKYKMAVQNQETIREANKLKLKAIELQYKKNKGNNDYKEAYKQANTFHKLEHVSSYPERVTAFKNAMMAPVTGAGDKDIIENLVRFIDPKGVIREGKVNFMLKAFKTFSMNPDGSINFDKYNRLRDVGFKGGFLTPEDRKELLEATIPMMRNFTDTYKLGLDQNRAIFRNRGWDENLLTPFETAVSTPELVEGARNKIYADYMSGMKDRNEYGQASTKAVTEFPEKVFDTSKAWIEKKLNFKPRDPEKAKRRGNFMEEIDRDYGQ